MATVVLGKTTTGQLIELLVDADGHQQVDLAGPLSSVTDSIDTARATQGSVQTLTSWTSDVSNEINCTGYNALVVAIEGAATTVDAYVELQGCLITGGTFGNVYHLAGADTTNHRLYANQITTIDSKVGNSETKVFVLPVVTNYAKIKRYYTTAAPTAIRVQPVVFPVG